MMKKNGLPQGKPLNGEEIMESINKDEETTAFRKVNP